MLDGGRGCSRPTRRRIWVVQWCNVVVDVVSKYAIGSDVRVCYDGRPTRLNRRWSLAQVTRGGAYRPNLSVFKSIVLASSVM